MTPVPWKQRTTKPAKADPISAQTRALVLKRSGGRCELCAANGTHLHHRQLRRGGEHGAGNLVNVCATCHTRLHGHPEWSLTHGWIVSQYLAPQDMPIMIGERWFRLSDDGSAHAVRGPSVAL